MCHYLTLLRQIFNMPIWDENNIWQLNGSLPRERKEIILIFSGPTSAVPRIKGIEKERGERDKKREGESERKRGREKEKGIERKRERKGE